MQFTRATVPQVELDLSVLHPNGLALDFDRVLFLDVDGVLHPENCHEDRAFCYAPNLHDALKDADQAATLPIVICSDWRLNSALPELRSHFPAGMRHQIVGVTPDLMNAMDSNRQSEVVAWMSRHSPQGRWLAIDDRPNWYEPDSPNVFDVPAVWQDGPGGLDRAWARKLAARLEKFLGPATRPGPAPR